MERAWWLINNNFDKIQLGRCAYYTCKGWQFLFSGMSSFHSVKSLDCFVREQVRRKPTGVEWIDDTPPLSVVGFQ